MRRLKTALASAALIVGMAGASAPAHADNGIIRIGQNCYIDIMGFLLPFPCPREVSGE